MSRISSSMVVGFDTERSRASTTFDGSFLAIGSALTVNPFIIIFDNQSDVDVPISVDGVNIWKTFAPYQSLVLDLRANHGIAENYTMAIGTQFTTNASVGTTGSMRISVNFGA